MKVFKNLFGDGSKIHGDEIAIGESGDYQTLAEYVNRSKVHIGEFTKQSGDPAGIQTINAVGFKPSIVLFKAIVQGVSTGRYSDGFGTPDINKCFFHTTTGLRYRANYAILIRQGSESNRDFWGNISEFTDTGFKISWNKSSGHNINESIVIMYTALG